MSDIIEKAKGLAEKALGGKEIKTEEIKGKLKEGMEAVKETAKETAARITETIKGVEKK